MLRLLIFFYIISNVTGNERNWWKFTEIYEVYIWSFKDTNGDGIGDLKGITSKMDYFKDLQIDSIWISPFFESSKIDMGYDVNNYTNVDPTFGTLADFEELSEEAEKREIKIFIDFVLNHSSDEHPWFQKSIEKIHPYDAYYIWKDPKGYDKHHRPIPPNNWMSLFGGSVWEWNDKRQQFYMHQFGKKQPDFDLRNVKVKQELKDVLEFWFNRGVSGVRMDACPYLVEDSEFRDQPLKDSNIKKENLNRFDYSEIYTKDLPENYDVIHDFRMFMDEVNRMRGGYERIMVVEAYASLSTTVAYYGTETYPVAQYPFNFEFARAGSYFTSMSLHSSITTWLESIPKHGVPTWNAENHDRSRVGSRFVREYSVLMNIIVMLLPGVPGIYYGQELCMVDGLVRKDQERDSVNLPGTSRTRDLPRTPMQWDNSLNAGFSSSLKPWLPVNPNYWYLNVESQEANEYSCLNLFKQLSGLRKTKTCKHGKFLGYKLSTWIYAFPVSMYWIISLKIRLTSDYILFRKKKVVLRRTLEEYDTYVIVLNLGTEYEIVNLHGQIPNLKVFLKVLVTSENSGYQKGDNIKVKSKIPNLFVMKPLSAVVLSSPNNSNNKGSE